MVSPCDFEVDVNGEETFLVNKEILSSFSGRLRKLFNKPLVATAARTLKIIFHDLPGGAEGFELMARFCYNNGRILITPGNTCLLHCVAHFMEMSEKISSSSNLIELTEKSLEGIPYWSWSEIVNALKQCHYCFPAANSSGMFDKILDSLVGRITTVANDASPTGSSPESSGFRFSFDTRSNVSTKMSSHRTWWFEDLVIMDPDMIEKVVKSMVFQKVDHALINKFLFYYLKNVPSDKKKRASEVVIDLLYCLDRGCIPCKGLFGILRLCSSLNLSKSCRNKLENMIGSQIDQATLDNLLIPAPPATESLYDVDLVLRFLKSFLSERNRVSIVQLKRLGNLMDSYLAEVAPDSSLKSSNFTELAKTLPGTARDSHDAIYRAIDMYLEVHSKLSEEEKLKLCSAINYDKLSSESCKHLARNKKFPSRTAIGALVWQQSTLKSLLEDTNSSKKKFCTGHRKRTQCKESQFEDGKQIILYAKKLDLSLENEKLKANLQGMQCRVMELEKLCSKMQAQIAKVIKTKNSTSCGSRSLPRLCS